MSSTGERNILSFRAGSGGVHKGAAVKLSSGSVVLCSASTDRAIGIAQNAADENSLVEVAMPGGGGFAKAGGIIAEGDLLGVDGNGDVVKVAAQHDVIIAQAMEGAVDNDIFSVQVIGPSMATQTQS